MDGQTDSIACCGITSLYVASRGNYGLVFYTPKIKKNEIQIIAILYCCNLQNYDAGYENLSVQLV